MTLTLRHLRKTLGGRQVLRDVSMVVPDGGFSFVLGPSGEGKTTLLRILAGLLDADGGELRFGERLMNAVPAHERRVGMVFQHPALWPHLTVADNVGYGLDVRGITGEERRRRLAEALAIVRMESFAKRLPEELSGGQQQRAALARALVIRPDVLLLDEPLSNLDPNLRGELREELRRIQAETQVTAVYVTHDQREALSLARTVAVLHGGVIEQEGKPQDLFERPATRFVADFLGEMNWVDGEVVQRTPRGVQVATVLGLLTTSGRQDIEGSVQVGFRPRHLQVGEAVENVFPVMVRRILHLGEFDEWEVAASGGVRLKYHTSLKMPVTDGSSALKMFVSPDDVVLISKN